MIIGKYIFFWEFKDEWMFLLYGGIILWVM